MRMAVQKNPPGHSLRTTRGIKALRGYRINSTEPCFVTRLLSRSMASINQV